MRTAVCQTYIIYENKKQNYEKAEEFIQRAAAQSCHIALFPEMSFTGFSMNTAVTGEKKRETVGLMRSLAAKYNIALGFGWTELRREKAENKYTILNTVGNVISEYTKIHPFSFSGEDKYFRRGKSISVFEFEGFKIATFICYDLRFPEIFQAASHSANLIIVPANWPEVRSEHWKTLLRARAVENMCYVAGINCVGDVGGIRYSGDSCVYDPAGKLLGEISGREDMLVVDIENDTAEYRKAFPVKKDRQPDLYKKLL